MNTQTQEALKMAIEFIENVHEGEWLYVGIDRDELLVKCKEALESQQKPLSEDAIDALGKFIPKDDFVYDLVRAVEKYHGIGVDK